MDRGLMNDVVLLCGNSNRKLAKDIADVVVQYQICSYINY